MSDFREHLLRLGRADETIRVYLYWVGRAEAAGIDVNTPDATQLRRWVDDFPPTAAQTRAGIRKSLTAYWQYRGLADPPTWAIRVPKERDIPCRALDPVDDRRMITAALADGGRRGLAVLCGMYLGLRRAEIASLRWDQFRTGWVNVVGKGSVQAELPVHTQLATALKRYRVLHAPVATWVFPSPDNHGPVRPTAIWRWTRLIAEQAGVDEVSPHRLRHSCLATANDATKDLRATQELARHASPETTARYTRVREARLISVVESIQYEAC